MSSAPTSLRWRISASVHAQASDPAPLWIFRTLLVRCGLVYVRLQVGRFLLSALQATSRSGWLQPSLLESRWVPSEQHPRTPCAAAWQCKPLLQPAPDQSRRIYQRYFSRGSGASMGGPRPPPGRESRPAACPPAAWPAFACSLSSASRPAPEIVKASA